MHLFIFFIIPIALLANKEEIRLLYPQIWTALQIIEYQYENNTELLKSKDMSDNCFAIEINKEICHNECSKGKKVHGKS